MSLKSFKHVFSLKLKKCKYNWAKLFGEPQFSWKDIALPEI